MSLTNSQNTLLNNIHYVIIIISLVANILSLILILIVRKFPKKQHSRLVFLLLVATLIGTINDSFSFSPALETNTAFCEAQGFIDTYIQLTASLMALTIAIHLFALIIREVQDSEILIKLEIICCSLSWILPLISAIIAIARTNIGYIGGWCWIVNTGNGNIYRFGVFYIPMFVIFTTISILFGIVIYKIYITRKQIKDKLHSKEQKKLYLTIMKLVFFPLGFLVVWLFPIIRRIYIWATGDDNFFLALMHNITSSSIGLVYSFIYGFDRDVKDFFKELCTKFSLWKGSYSFSNDAAITKDTLVFLF